MPELNPYEPPQSESKLRPREKSFWSTRGSLLLDWLVPLLIGLQILSGVLCFAFDFMQAMAHSGYERLQAIAAFFAVCVFVLSVGLFLLAIVCRYLKLLLFEVLVLFIILWSTRPIMN